jgi:hypothetical protein
MIIECSPKDISYSVAADRKSITFYPCRFTSYNPHDVEQRYCVRCHRFMDLLEAVRDLTDRFFPEPKERLT